MRAAVAAAAPRVPAGSASDVAGAAIAFVGSAIALAGVALAGVALAAAPEPPAGATACSGCHATAAGVPSPVPRLAGRDPAEMLQAMQEFRSGQRVGTVMDRIARGFTDDEVRAIAAWYASQR